MNDDQIDFLDQIPAPHPEAAFEEVDGHLMIATPADVLISFADEGAEDGDEDEAGDSCEVAERMVALVDGKRTVRQIAACICEEYDVEEAQAQADLTAFFRELIEDGALILLPHS